MQQLWEKERISISASRAAIKGQSFAPAVLVLCLGGKGTGMARAWLGNGALV